jgi:hypothetical protein
MSLLSTSVDANMNLVGDCRLPENLVMDMDSQGSSAKTVTSNMPTIKIGWRRSSSCSFTLFITLYFVYMYQDSMTHQPGGMSSRRGCTGGHCQEVLLRFA